MNNKYYTGYTIGLTKTNKHVLVTILVPKKSNHNIKRKTVNSNFAKYICETAYIYNICDISCLKLYNQAYIDNLLIPLNINKWVMFSNYKEGISGLNFYLDKTVAKESILNTKKDGILTKYYDNGRIQKKVNYKNGLYHGYYLEYTYLPKYKLIKKFFYYNGKPHGNCIEYKNGNQINIYFYEHGNLLQTESIRYN